MTRSPDGDAIGSLKRYLEAQAAGPIDASKVAGLLSQCWHVFKGTRETKMRMDKLHRMEEPKWVPPMLTFLIERHGATVMGSSRAAVHVWALDLETLTATVAEDGRRQLYPMDKQLDVKPLAQNLADAITNGDPDPRLKWARDGSVKVNIGEVIPATNKQTTAGRRRRLRDELSRLLWDQGWKSVRPNVYTPP